ncbi:MAG TPA: hypothetical protein PLX02_14220 [Syntrophorhabdaceae bacterium]|nr:hypothetical protein [Syntrophorhabdaceae bacterium]HQM82764.1 hypothetical protein [Syntrophorhabdaceae bacterium]
MYRSVVRNTLLTPSAVNKILALPADETACASLLEILAKFQDIKKFASEIHTEIHVIKPILKLLGLSYESKPKFFEEHIKEPDAVLFSSEEERFRSSQLWGTVEYYAKALGILLLKRYGRNLQEGITGFFLEFENRIPTYQIAYLLKKSKTPWGILTNGREWILVKRPAHYELRLLSLDLETAMFENDRDALHIFNAIFSLTGLTKTIPNILDEERDYLIELLREKRALVQQSLQGARKRVEVYPKMIDAFKDLFGDRELACSEAYLLEKKADLSQKTYAQPDGINEHNVSDISSFLFNKKGYEVNTNLEGIFLAEKGVNATKEQLLALKILDMTPNFGNLASDLVEGLAYFAFVLPYREKNTFIAEWEDETLVKRYIVDNILYGVERSHLALDILQIMIRKRFNAAARHFTYGNPLIGMSVEDVSTYFDAKSQMGLFDKNPQDIINDFKETYRLYFSLSDRIKEDVQVREELEKRLKRNGERIRGAMDLIVSTYFNKTVDNKRIQDVLSHLDSDDVDWENLAKKDWFVNAKTLARNNGFFHFDVEFPFLLNGAFDFIFVQPALQYIWEENFPLAEATRAYVKRGMPYLKQGGRMVIIIDNPDSNLAGELQRSTRYETDVQDGMIVLKKK